MDVNSKGTAMATNDPLKATQDSVANQAEDVASKASRTLNDLKADAGEFCGVAGAKIKDAASTGKDKAADGVHALADAARSAGGKFDGKTQQYAERAAEGLDRFSETLKQKSVDDMAADAKSFVKEHPAIAAGAAALIGFALVRFLKSNSSDGYED